MMQSQLLEAIEHWNHVAPIVQFPTSKKAFNALVAQLDELLDMIGNNENHPLIGLVDVMSHLVMAYEEQHYPKLKVRGVEALRYLMDEHHLSQSDLPEIGSQGVISEILCEKRALNLRQIKQLAKRFEIDAATFIDDD